MDMNPLLRPHQKIQPEPKKSKNTSMSFAKVPKNITRNQAKGGLIDRQELDRVNEEVAFLSI